MKIKINICIFRQKHRQSKNKDKYIEREITQYQYSDITHTL